MKYINSVQIGLIAAIWLGSGSGAWALPQMLSGRQALAGLEGVDISVELPADAAEFGIERQAVIRNIEAHLQSARIRLLGKESPRRQGIAVFAVQVLSHKEARHGVIYSITSSVVEPVILLRDGNTVITARIWQAEVGLGTPKHADGALILAEIDRQIAVFAQDYRAVNPVKD
jgi:hypothetical protein